MKKHTLLVLLALVLSSCSSFGFLVGGKSTSFFGEYALPSKGSVEASKSKLRQVLQADGWNVSAETVDRLDFGNSSSTGSGLVGHSYAATIKATFSDESVVLHIYRVGNFKFGTEAKTTEEFERIKSEYEK